MQIEESAFEDELEIYRRQVDWALQCFYASLALNGHPAKHRGVLDAMNRTPLFWNTVRGSLQSTTWIVLGRIFDQDSNHNIDRLLGYAQKCPSIFSKEALGLRKLRASPDAHKWLAEYLSHTHVPTADDFRRLRKHIARYRRVYEAKYRPIRDKLHAHTELTGQQASGLYSNTTIREVETLLTFLKRLYEALWQVFHNGRRPVLRSIPYSAARMLRRHDDVLDPWRQPHVQQIIFSETIRALNAFSSGVKSLPAGVRSPHAKQERKGKSAT